MFSVDAGEILEQGFCVGVGVWVYRGGGDFVRSPFRGRRESDGIDEIPEGTIVIIKTGMIYVEVLKESLPSPVALDFNGVGACVQKDLSSFCGGPCCSSWKWNLRSACSVRYYVGIFIAIGTVIDNGKVIEARVRRIGGYHELDVVAAFIEALDISSSWWFRQSIGRIREVRYWGKILKNLPV